MGVFGPVTLAPLGSPCGALPRVSVSSRYPGLTDLGIGLGGVVQGQDAVSVNLKRTLKRRRRLLERTYVIAQLGSATSL